METIDMSDVDVVPIKIKFKGTTYEPKLIIYDSKPPEFTVKNIDSFLNVPRSAEDFVVDTVTNMKVPAMNMTEFIADGLCDKLADFTVDVLKHDKG